VTYWGGLPSNVRVPASDIDPKLITTAAYDESETASSSYGNI